MSLILIIEAVILASSCSIDAFSASFAYGNNKIKIPFLSNQIINIICCLFLGLSLFIGSITRNLISPNITTIICFIILFVLGIIKLFDSITKSIIRKHNHIDKKIKFSLFNFKVILHLYANPIDADFDKSRIISPIEAIMLSISLSLDGLAIGFGAAIGNINPIIIIITSLITNTIAILFGSYLGNKLATKSSFNLSWISGVILIILAILKIS